MFLYLQEIPAISGEFLQSTLTWKIHIAHFQKGDTFDKLDKFQSNVHISNK
jgi:hypothetical protein